MLFPEVKNKKKLKSITTQSDYKELIDEALWLYNKYHSDIVEALKLSDYMIFYTTGSRHEYEKKYFERRARLSVLAALSLLYDKQEYIEELEDIIWAVCDEYTWALPAHTDLGKSGNEEYIDLFAAETGASLAETYYMLNEKLNDVVKKRIKKELNRRIIQSFIKRKYHWETIENNWAAVCCGSVGIAFIYMEPELFGQIEERIKNAMVSFLKSFKDDGVCREGHDYWTYGFGYFVYYAQLLRDFTEGKNDYFKLPKVKEIAKFQQKVFIQGSIIASFSDSKINGKYAVGLSHFLKAEYPNDIEIPDIAFRSDFRNGTGDNCFRFAAYIRSLLWFNKDLCFSVEKYSWYYMKDSQWYINKKKVYSFATKGGNNDEPHNHNDIGSFIIAADNRQFLCDIGAGEYTKDYFDNLTRYKLLCNSSLGHSVPIICGEEQMYGADYKGNIVYAAKDEVRIEIHDAYKVKSLQKATRRFLLKDDCVILQDSFVFSDNKSSVTERFITKIKPEIVDDCVNIDYLKIKYPKSISKVNIWEKSYKSRGAIDDVLYGIDFSIYGGGSFDLTFQFNFIGL